MDVFLRHTCECDVVCASLYCVYEVYESTCEDPAGTDDFCEVIELANERLQLHLCASASAAPFRLLCRGMKI